jgi:hypothetical protein
MSKWKVKYMDKNLLPPYPFGQCEVEVEANSRKEAVEIVKSQRPVSLMHKITASKIS